MKEAKGKRPEVEKEPARGGGEDVWSAQAEAEVAQGGGFPEHLVVMVNGLVGRWWIRVTVYFWFIALLVSSDATCWHLACSRKISLVVFFFCSADDWKFAAEQFVRRMPEKVIVHREYPQSIHRQIYLLRSSVAL